MNEDVKPKSHADARLILDRLDGRHQAVPKEQQNIQGENPMEDFVPPAGASARFKPGRIRRLK